MDRKKPDLISAYSLSSATEAQTLYAEWAPSYDESFAEQEQYLLPEATAQAFVAAGGQGPVLDVGAGTGLCGVALHRHGVVPIDATDISPDMLAQALRKDVYRDVIEADLYQGIHVPRNSYQGVTSSGTFTHGHVGPEVLPALLKVAAPGAQFALSINARFYRKAGFETALDRLQSGSWIKNLSLSEVRIYGAAADAAHRDETALIATFQKG